MVYQNLTNLSIDEFKSVITDTLQEAVSKALAKLPISRPPEAEELIKIGEVAKMLGVTTVTIHDWKKKGKLPFYRIANKIYFKKNEVIETLRRIEGRKI